MAHRASDGLPLTYTMRPGQVQPNELELAVLNRIANQEPSIREWFTDLRVLSREYTGVGCFTRFQTVQSLTMGERQLALNALIRVPGVSGGLGAMLSCEDGRPKCLEMFTYGNEHWDGLYDGFSLEDTA